MQKRIIDRLLSALFRLADYITSRTTSTPTGENPSVPVIRFTPDDAVAD